MDVKIKLMNDGVLPQMQRDGDVCFDCYCAESGIVQKGTRRLIKLGFALELPVGYEAVLRPRSGMSKNGIDVAIGTIDTNYRGEVMANIINNSSSDLGFVFGDRICQMAIREVPQINLISVDELSETVRGEKGFGSTGIK